MMNLNSAVPVLILVSGAALLVASPVFTHHGSGASGQSSRVKTGTLGNEAEGRNGNKESGKRESFAHGAIAGVLPSSAGVGEELPGARAWQQVSPFDREFRDLLETLHKGSRQARTGRSLWRAIGDWLRVSGGPTDTLGQQTLLDPEFGEFSLSVATRLGLRQWTPSRGSGNDRAAAAALRDFESNLLAAMERTAMADPEGMDYARAPISVNRSSPSDGSSLVISGNSWTSGSSASNTYTGTTGASPAPSWYGLPATASAGGSYAGGNGSASGGSSLLPVAFPLPAAHPIWSYAAPSPVTVHTSGGVRQWNSPSALVVSTVQTVAMTPAVTSAPVAPVPAKRSTLLAAPATSGGASIVTPLVGAAVEFYVANLNGASVSQVTTAGVASTFSNSGLSEPEGVAFDAAGNLYVTNFSSNTIEKYPSTAGVLSSSGTTFINSGLSGPTGLAFDTAGNLYVANGTGNTIEKYPSTAGVLSSTGTQFSSGLSNPHGLAFDTAGDLYAANSSNSTIEKYTSTLGVLSNSGTTFSNNSTGASAPQDLAFDAAGDLYVTNDGNTTIEKYTATGGVLSGTGTTFTSNGVTDPTGLAFDAAGDLFLANADNNTIQKYTATAGVLSNTATTFTNSGLNEPEFIAFAPIPEPGSAVLVVTAGLGLLLRRRRRGGGGMTNDPAVAGTNDE